MRLTYPEQMKPHQTSAIIMLRRAFGGEVPEHDFYPLLFLLGSEMSMRALAQFMSDMSGRDAADLLQHVYAAMARMSEVDQSVRDLRARLAAFGFEEWVAEINEA